MSQFRKSLLLPVCVSLMLLPLPLLASASTTPTEGGSIVVSYKNDVATLDPAIGYDWQNWTMIKNLFEGLMGYKPGTSELEPRLAKSYTISDDGATYTFELRDGVMFHNGRVMTAKDVKYSWERAINPDTKSPGAGFFSNIKGYDDIRDGNSTDLSGVEIPDDTTIIVHLKSPDATFLQVMAINFAFVVPTEAVEEYGKDFGRHPVGTGPFKLEEWKPGQRIVFARNQKYRIEGIPRLDEVVFSIGMDPTIAVKRLEAGEVDILGNGIPSAQYLSVVNDPKLKSDLVEGPDMQTSYITLNTHIKPFDNVKVRKAVNMAINKRRIVQIMNGRAIPAHEILPPTLPGFIEGEKGYPFDPDQAKSLLAEAGYKDGFTTELYVFNVEPHRRIAQSIQHDLKKIGISVKLQARSQATVIGKAASKDGVPMVWSGGMGWIADYPDPANFYWPILSCSSAQVGGWNWAKYCNTNLDKEANKADSMADPSQKNARADLWGDIYKRVMEDAPWVPVFHKKRITLRSSRMGGGDKLYVGLIAIPANYAYVWVKKDAQ